MLRRVLGRYVREQHALSLIDALRKMTLLPAERLSLQNKGRIRIGADADLTNATKIAIQEMVEFLTETRGLTKHQAYQVVSMAGNVAITQLVDKPNVGVHVRMPKSIFKK